MSSTRTLQLSFSGGEMSPMMFGKIDDQKTRSGLATCRNFIPKAQGPVENRAGLGYVREVKDSTKKTRMIPFTYSTTQTMALELGAGYFRFHTFGATLLYTMPATWVTGHSYAVGDLAAYGGVNYYCPIAHTSGTFSMDLANGKWYLLPSTMEYEIPNTFAEADLFDIHYVQSADVLTLTHPNYPPQELRRLGATQWTLTVISFSPLVSAPTGVAATPSGGQSATYPYKYVVTAIAAADNLSESAASSPVSLTGNLLQSNTYTTISWNAVTGAALYNVYKLNGGVYGYIGQTSTLSIIDDNITADLSKTPPTYDAVFGGAGDYPGAVSYYEQRRAFAGTINKPQNFWMTRAGTESTMSYSLPIRDDDRIAVHVAAREANTIRHIVPLSQLILLTSAAEWRVTSINTDAMTPSSIDIKPQSYIGASNVQPIIVNMNMVYVAARGGHIRECTYNWQSNGFITGDLSLRTAHLFDTYDIQDMAFSKAPQPIVWLISTSGLLLGLTYIPEQQIGAWHKHDTINGTFESCCVVAEGSEDFLYVVVRRFINGTYKRYIERLSSRMFSDQKNAFFVDCGLTYNGSPTSTVSGLNHLEGQTVSILADGAVHPQRTVTSGSISLDNPASIIQVGLPITADLYTLPVALQIDGFGQGRTKNVSHAWVRVFQSSGLFIGPDADHLTAPKSRTTEMYGVAPALKSEEIPVMTTPSWADGGQVFIRQVDPLPLTVVSLTLKLTIGG